MWLSNYTPPFIKFGNISLTYKVTVLNMNFVLSALLLCSSIANNAGVDAFAFAPNGHFSAVVSKATSSTRLSETAVEEEEELNTLMHSSTIYGDVVADENIRYVYLCSDMFLYICEHTF